jgi:hypothetical protein
MKYAALLSLFLIACAFAQSRRQKSPDEINLPNGRKWNDAIVEAEHAANIKDARALAQLSTEIRDDIEASDKFVLSLQTLRKVEDAEKLLKNLRGRMRKN